MPVDTHIVETVDGSANLRTDRVLVGVLANVANSSGTNVSTTISGLSLPVDASGNALYGVVVTTNQATALPVSVTNKTATGFHVVITGTVSAGTFDCFIFA